MDSPFPGMDPYIENIIYNCTDGGRFPSCISPSQ